MTGLADTTDLVSARPATADDITTTAALANQAMDDVRDDRGGRWHLDHDIDRASPLGRHAKALEADDQAVFVGCIDGVVVGYGLAELSPTVDGRLCMIEELLVHPEAQAIGVGSAVLEAIRDWAVAHDCQAIESQVLPGNRESKNFFERVGMKTRKMRVSADL